MERLIRAAEKREKKGTIIIIKKGSGKKFSERQEGNLTKYNVQGSLEIFKNK